jgi:rare lipoprotein A
MKLTWTIVIAALVAAVLFLALAPRVNAFEFDGRNLCVRGNKVGPCMRDHAYSDIGIASVYDYKTKNRTASGKMFDGNAPTAAHRWLPFRTRVRVINLRNKKSIVVTINDRGPFFRGRIIDLTPAGSRAIGFSGLAKVRVEMVK